MKIAFVVNNILTELPRYTSMVLAWEAGRRGHDVYIAGAGDFSYLEDGTVGLRAVRLPKAPSEKIERVQEYITRPDAPRTLVTSKELDVIFNRYNPSDDLKDRPWAQVAPVAFSQMAITQGVIVLPDPVTLWNNIDKLYFQYLPEKVRPRAIITRDAEEIRRFWKAHDEKIILKPLQGSGGKDVFMVNDLTNLNQMIETISRNGYIIAQEYLPAAKKGDVRMFLLNGKPLMAEGKYAAFRRVTAKGEVRSNMHAGGKPDAVEVTDKMLEIAEAIRPLLVRDGIFLAGIDLAGDKLMEINAHSPGGMHTASRTYNTWTFSTKVIEAIERKVMYKKMYGESLSNRELNCTE